MTENLESYIVTMGIMLVILYLIIKGNQSSKCPKCKANYFSITKTKEDYLGNDFANPKKHIFRNYYRCRKCNHEWAKDIYRSKKD
ncbi:DUF6671 family protein [Aquimarina algiphila]|uniref:DUF6671 family protein n=1 Tax=Aquimarina algiphila TaxID=2047982 RepID=UPI003CD0D6AC